MLLKTVYYDENATNWTRDNTYNFMLLRNREKYINDLVRFRGYVYLNQICEILGIGWDPKEDNVCIIKLRDEYRIPYVEFDVFEAKGNVLMINICVND